MNGAWSDLLEHVEEAGEARRDRFRAPKLDALARGDPRDRAEHREPMIAPRVDDAASQAAPERPGSGSRRRVARMWPPTLPELLDDRLDPVRTP